MRPDFKKHSIIFKPQGPLEMTIANHQKKKKNSVLGAGMFHDLGLCLQQRRSRGLISPENAKAQNSWSPRSFCGRKSQDFIKQRGKLALGGQNILFRHSDGNTNRPIQFLVGSWFVALLNVRHSVLRVRGMFALQRIISTSHSTPRNG